MQLDAFKTADLRQFLNHWRKKKASTRANIVSVLHSFFGWAEAEDLIDLDPSRKIRRPPKRKPDIYRPSLDELDRIRSVATLAERPAIVLMEGAGLRLSEVAGTRWQDIDLIRGRVRVYRKGPKCCATASGRSIPNSITTCSSQRSSDGCPRPIVSAR